MDTGGFKKPGLESRGSPKPGTPEPAIKNLDQQKANIPFSSTSKDGSPSTPIGFKLKSSVKGVENAKKRLRAFSIQKKTPITPVVVQKKASSGSATVLIGKLTSVKTTPKPDPDAEPKEKPPKPPKPGQKTPQSDSYIELQRRTLSEIEDMKRKMELVDLGIPLGLIAPTTVTTALPAKAMPTKAMPTIKTFLDQAKLDEIICDAKKARAEGREFKFDYHKLLPDYDNPFQRKKDGDVEVLKKIEPEKPVYKPPDKVYHKTPERSYKSDKDKRRNDKYDRDRRQSFHKKDTRDHRKDDRDRHRDKSKDTVEKKEGKDKKSVEKETDVNLSDYLVCDSWSLDNEDKTNSSSPKRQETTPLDVKKSPAITEKTIVTPEIKEVLRARQSLTESPKTTPVRKMEKLKTVRDALKYEGRPREDKILDIFDERLGIESYAKVAQKKDDYGAGFEKMFDFENKDSNDALADDTFLESVINEIKQECLSDDENCRDKGLVEYDSPSRENSPNDTRSVTPELDDRMRDLQSSRSDYSDGYRSTESGYKSTESGYKSNASYRSDTKSDNYRMSTEKDLPGEMAKSTVDSLETWSFVLKICQPLLFRHDRNKCYRESRTLPKIWFMENPKLCSCVKDRAIVYEELETCKMGLVDRVYGCDQIPESESPKARSWYPRFAKCLSESSALPIATSTEWEADDSQNETLVLKEKGSFKSVRSTTPVRTEEMCLDREYQRFMEAVWPEVTETKSGTPRSTTPVKLEARKKKAEDVQDDKKKPKKMKLSSEGWSQESDIEEEDKSKKMEKVARAEKLKLRKRKHSPSPVSDSDNDSKKKKKSNKKKANKKTKSKLTKRRRLGKKYLKKLKEKHKKKKKVSVSEEEDVEKETKKKEKKLKRKKLQKKKKATKKKKAKAKSSSSSSSTSSESSSDSESDTRKKKKKSDVKKKKRKQSSSDSTQSEDLFDVNVLNNIKAERLSDDEKKLQFSPRRQKPREIINVKELQNDFVSVQIKQEVEDKDIVQHVQEIEQLIQREEKEFATEPVHSHSEMVPELVPEVLPEMVPEMVPESDNTGLSQVETAVEEVDLVMLANIPIPEVESQFKEPFEIVRPIERPEVTQPEESNLSQSSSQESTTSHSYEKDDSHLRPSSQNSNYSFNDVISASQSYHKEEDNETEAYEQGNYEMYEQLAMAYQSDVAKQVSLCSPHEWRETQRIETLVRARARGEIKCDWRPGALPAPAPGGNAQHRPSRWGLKPGEVNIVLTGGNNDQYPIQNVVEPVYQIQSLANIRTENSSTGSYDEAYEDMYGASDRLQYGDCFASNSLHPENIPLPDKEMKASVSSSLDDRINQALRTTVLGEVAKVSEESEADKENRDKGILMTKSEARGAKRVSFADGYKPGQDSDVEEPPKRKKKKKFGCAWPCPATHPDHVPLWDALPPPPPPPGSPPPPLGTQQPNIMPQGMLQLPPPMIQQQQMMQQQLMQQGMNPAMLQAPPFAMGQKMDPSLPNFMPPEPPPGIITFQ